MLPVVADFERSVIQERVRAGLCGLWGILKLCEEFFGLSRQAEEFLATG